jgi:hypothetical protein
MRALTSENFIVMPKTSMGNKTRQQIDPPLIVVKLPEDEENVFHSNLSSVVNIYSKR